MASKRALDKTLSALLEKSGSGLSPVIDDLQSKFSTGWVDTKPYFSVSQLFYCPRKAFFARLGAPRSDNLSSCLKMHMGTVMHELFQDSMERVTSGYGFREFEVSSDSLSVTGHIDGLILEDGKLVEIKTVSSHGAMSIRRRGMPDYYLGQANLYCYLWNKKYKRKLTKIWFIVLSRDSMEFINLEPVAIDTALQKKTVSNIKRYCNMWEGGNLPPRKAARCEDCSLNSICGSSERISDFLPGGKFRA